MGSFDRTATLALAALLIMTAGTVTHASALNSWQDFFAGLFGGTVSAQETQQPVEQNFVLGVCDLGGGANAIEVESSGGTALAGYSTVGAAFTAINAGTHTGTITIEVCGSTSEGATPATLMGNGQGAANYGSIWMYTLGNFAITGNPATGFGVIQLKGVDNFTLDGDNPMVAGTTRSLTINNFNAPAAIAGSLIRVATVAAVAPSADNITLRNMNLNGNVTGGNSSGVTLTTGSSNSSFGIYVGGNGGTTATDAPTAITSVTAQVIPTGTTVNSFVVENNAITNAARGIVFNGNATAQSNGVTIAGNTIGNPTAGSANGVYSMGMTVQGSSLVNIRDNNVYVESFITTSVRGIDVGGISGNVTGVTIERNRVLRVWANSNQGFGAYGINYQGGINSLIRNNFVSNINAYMSNGSISATFGPHGIRISSANAGHRVIHNSVNLYGPYIFSFSISMSSALTITSSSATGMEIRNNILANTMTGEPAGTPVACISLPAGLTSAFNLTENNNAYYSNLQLGQSGAASVSGFTVAGFDPGSTSGATNWRSYTSTLLAANTNNDNASFATSAPAPFTSTSDLHIPAATLTLLESGGATTTVLTDIDNEIRPNGVAPDIGADEFAGTVPPANDITPNAFVVPANSSLVATGMAPTPQASFTNIGTAPQAAIGVQFKMMGPGGYSYIDNQMIPALSNGATTTVTFAAAPTITTPGAYTMSSVVMSADANIGNNTIDGGFTAASPIGGSISVGTGSDYTSLTNPGGAFDAINGLGASSNITINITSDLTAETGVIPLNPIAGGFSVFVQNVGAARTISGSNTVALIDINGADGVSFVGLGFGGRSLTIRNNSATTGGVFRYLNDASNNLIRSCIIEQNNPNSTPVVYGTGTTTGNDSNTVMEVLIRGTSSAVPPFNGVASIGTSGAISNTALNVKDNEIVDFGQSGILMGAGTDAFDILNNDIRQTAARTTEFSGIIIASGPSVVGSNIIQGNRIHSLISGVSSNAMRGIQVGDGGLLYIENNQIYDFQTTAGATGAIVGIEFDGVSGGTPTLNINNNFVSILPTVTTAQQITGIFDFAFGGNSFVAQHNSIYIAGTASGATPSWALRRGTAAPTGFTSRNNVAINNRTGGTSSHFAGADQSAATGTFVANGNLYGGTGSTPANYMDYGTAAAGTPVSFAAWQTGPPTRDAAAFGALASTYAISTIFVNAPAGDLHIKPTAGANFLGAGLVAAGLSTDIDFDPRNVPIETPDRGADELVRASAGIIPAGTYNNVWFNGLAGDTMGGNVTINGTLYINGFAPTGPNTLTFGCNALSASGDNGSYLYGNVAKTFCRTDSFSYPIGTLPDGSGRPADESPDSGELTPEGSIGEYSPATVNVTAGTFPSTLTITVVDTWMPRLGQTSSLSRYWNVTETGDLTVDMTMQYLPEDIHGNEAAYSVYRLSGPFPVQQPGSVNAALNTFTATNVSSFSGWGAGVVVPTAATADVSGRVLTADGRPIRNVEVMINGEGLQQPIFAHTGNLGYYNFADLPIGSYVLTVNSKRFTFNNPVRILTLKNSLLSEDFVAEPQE